MTPAARAHLDGYLALVVAYLKRHVARHAHRLRQADGRLSDLYVSVEEAAGQVSGASEPPPGWPDRASADEAVTAAERCLSTGLDDLDDDSTFLPLEEIRAAYRLGERELRLLVAAAAPALSVDLARLYTFAWADFAVKQPTAGFLAELVLGASEPLADALVDLTETSPLVRGGLLTLGAHRSWDHTPLLHAPVTVPAQVVAFMQGWPTTIPERFSDVCRWYPADGHGPAPVIPEVLARRVRQLLQRAAYSRSGRPVLALLGPRGSGRRSLVAHEVAAQQRGLVVTELAAAAADPEQLDALLAVGSREARLRNAAWLVRGEGLLDDAEPFERCARPLIRRLSAHRGPLVLTAERLVGGLGDLETELVEARFELPEAAAQVTHWRRAVTGMAAADAQAAVDRLAERFTLSPGAIYRAADRVRLEADLGLVDGARFDALAAAVRRGGQQLLSRVAEPFSTSLTWDDVVLPDGVVERLHEILASLRHRAQVYDDWGFRQKMSYGGGLSCLFSGPPGTGKTMMAAVLAGSVGRELFRVDLSRVVSKWIGETEKNLAMLFDEAERAQIILLFDEADSLFATRTEVSSSNDRFANMEINYLLQRMESYDGMTILTTNFAESIDEAFKRRIRFRIDFPFPDEKLRASLWRSMIPAQAAVAEGIDFAGLGQRFELAGGSIKNAVLRAAIYAAQANGPIGGEQLLRAAKAEAQEMGRLVRD